MPVQHPNLSGNYYTKKKTETPKDQQDTALNPS